MSIDDPRLTAYALGELDPAEQAELEALLQSDPAAAHEVAELRELAALVRTELTAEVAPPLAEEQKREILAEAERPSTAAAFTMVRPAPNEVMMPVANWRRVWIPASLAASLAVAGVYGWMLQQHQEQRQAAPLAAASPTPLGSVQISLEDEPAPMVPPPPASEPALAPSTPPLVNAPETPLENLGLARPDAKPATSLVDAITSRPSPAPSATATGRERKEMGKADSYAHSTVSTPAAAADASRAKNESISALGAMGSASAGGAFGGQIASADKDLPVLGESLKSLSVPESRAGQKPSSVVTSAAPAEAPLSGRVGDASKSRSLFAGRRVLEESESPRDRRETVLRWSDVETQPANTEAYDAIHDNAFQPVASQPLSTFSIDVDTASYANVRRFLTGGSLPPKDAVRIEELVNYFPYQYPQPQGDDPFSVNMEVAACPWTPQHRLLRIGLKARDLDAEKRPASNLVFLIDVSGSMQPENKLPLVKKSLRLLVKQLAPRDTVGIVVYAGATGTVLEPTSDKKEILAALDHLEAGGSTNGGAGIRLAYDLAKQEFAKEKTNRVILATDGDFNVGLTSQTELTKLITEKARSGVFLSVLGFGYGNLKDNTMEKLADKGNGNYAYIDTMAEGRKVLVEQMAGTLFTVAKDVKMQIEFNPALVGSYRLLGYENRMLAKEDFNDDKKDAGEIGAGHTVTALYEIVPAGQATPGAIELTKVDAPRYAGNVKLKEAAKSAADSTPEAELVPPGDRPEPAKQVERSMRSRPTAGTELLPALAGSAPVAVAVEKPIGPDEMLTLKLRWKAPDGVKSTKREFPLVDKGQALEKSSADFRWAASIASFGMLLRDSPYKGEATWASTREMAEAARGEKSDTYRTEFLELLKKAQDLAE